MNNFLKRLAKGATGALGAGGSAVALGLVPSPWNIVISAVIAVATAFGVYQVPYVAAPVKGASVPVVPPAS